MVARSPMPILTPGLLAGVWAWNAVDARPRRKGGPGRRGSRSDLDPPAPLERAVELQLARCSQMELPPPERGALQIPCKSTADLQAVDI